MTGSTHGSDADDPANRRQTLSFPAPKAHQLGTIQHQFFCRQTQVLFQPVAETIMNQFQRRKTDRQSVISAVASPGLAKNEFTVIVKPAAFAASTRWCCQPDNHVSQLAPFPAAIGSSLNNTFDNQAGSLPGQFFWAQSRAPFLRHRAYQSCGRCAHPTLSRRPAHSDQTAAAILAFPAFIIILRPCRKWGILPDQISFWHVRADITGFGPHVADA